MPLAVDGTRSASVSPTGAVVGVACEAAAGRFDGEELWERARVRVGSEMGTT